MRQIGQLETVTPSDVDDRNVRVLHDEELDAVFGGRKAGGGDMETYLVLTMSDCVITSYSP